MITNNWINKVLLLPQSHHTSLRFKMVYDFQTCEVSHKLTLHETYTYIWSRSLELAKDLCWEVCAGLDGHSEVLRWIDSLDVLILFVPVFSYSLLLMARYFHDNFNLKLDLQRTRGRTRLLLLGPVPEKHSRWPYHF